MPCALEYSRSYKNICVNFCDTTLVSALVYSPVDYWYKNSISVSPYLFVTKFFRMLACTTQLENC